MGRGTTGVELELVREAKRLWPRLRGQFRDDRLRDVQEDLESSAIERVLRYRHTLSRLQGPDREAALLRTLMLGAVDEARKTTGSANSHVRKLLEIPAGESVRDEDDGAGDADPNLSAAELLAALNLTGEERVIAGCYALGARSARDIARVIDKPPSYVTERLRTLLPYLRGMLADRVAPGLDERTRNLICGYAQGELNTTRRWRERHNAQRLIANDPDCATLWRAQLAADKRLGIMLPLPAVIALSASPAGGAREHLVHTASAVREHVADATAGARRHAAGLYHKAIDPTPLAGVRPGAAGAVLASCLTIGGGGAYCISASVNPIEAVQRTFAPAQDKPKPSSKPRRIAQPATTVAATPAPAAARERPERPKRAPSATSATSAAPPPPPPPSPRDEFGPEAASSSSSAAASPASSARSQPAPAPATGSGEFAP